MDEFMTKPNRNAVELSSAKRSNDGVIKTVFSVSRKEGGDTFVDKQTNESAQFPHPDLMEAFDDLKPILHHSWGKNDIITILDNMPADTKESVKKIRSFVNEGIKEDLQKITITGIHVSGLDANKGCIITGTYESKNGVKVAMNSPRIKFTDTSMGRFSEDIEKVHDAIEEECYEYVFNGKKAQLSIDFDGEGSPE
jgi:hypothetical protein